MKKAISLILALVMCLSLCACGNKKEEERISALISDTMSQFGITEYEVNVKDWEIVAPKFKSLSDSQKLSLVKCVRSLDGVPRTISDGHASYYYEPYSIAQNAPQPGLYEGSKLILVDKNPFS